MTFVLGLVALIQSATPPHAELNYVRGPGAQACDRQRLEDAVATRLGYQPFSPGAALRVAVEISGQRKLTARVRISQPGAPPSESSVNGPSDCESLTDALALALAVAIDPLMLSRPPPQTGEPSPPVPLADPPAPVLPPVEMKVVDPQPPAPPPPVPDESTRLSIHALGGLDLGSIPGGWGSVTVGARLTLGFVGLELDPFVVLPGRGNLEPSGRVGSWALGGKASGCWLWKMLSVCAALGGGQIHYAADELVNAQEGWVGFVAAGPRLSLILPAKPQVVAFKLQGELWVPIARAAMRVSQDIVWRQSIAGGLQLGVELYIL